MKKYILMLTLLVGALQGFAQEDLKAKKPKIMVIPSDFWMNDNGFTEYVDNQGTKTPIQNYDRAFRENIDLINVIAKINGLMEDRGFPIEKLDETIKKIQRSSVIDNVLTSKSGSTLSESKYDKMMKVAKPDIVINLTWKLEKSGIRRAGSFTMEGVDAYTSKSISTETGPFAPSAAAPIEVMLEEAVLARMDNFNDKLKKHFEDMFLNGREVVIILKKWGSWDGDFEKEYNGKELNELIENWFVKNTVKGRFSTNSSADLMTMDQVRIPIYDEEGKPLDTKGFARKLVKFLKEAPFNITCKLLDRGLGEATIILGEK